MADQGPVLPVGVKVCDNASVGVLIRDDDGRLLMFDRAIPPARVAPVSGHVFDDHDSFMAAARAMVTEEVGLVVTSLALVVDQWVGNRCGRAPATTGRVGHHWHVYRATVTGQLAPSGRETRNARWLDPLQVQELAERTVAWARGELTDLEFAHRPGLEPVWVWWLTLLRIVHVDDPDLLQVLALAERGGAV